MLRVSANTATFAAAAGIGKRRCPRLFRSDWLPGGLSSSSNPASPAATSASASSATASSSSASATPSPRHRNSRERSRLGIGGSKLALVDPAAYAAVVRTALKEGVTTFESGHGGEGRLAAAVEAAAAAADASAAAAVATPRSPELGGSGDGGLAEDSSRKAVTLTARFGYRTRLSDPYRAPEDGSGAGDNAEERRVFEGDVLVEPADLAEVAAAAASRKDGRGERPGSDDVAAAKETAENGRGGGAAEGPDPGRMVAVHNLSRDYALHKLASSPLVELRRQIRDAAGGPSSDMPGVNLVYMAHNPEAQSASLLHASALGEKDPPPPDELREMVRERLTDAFLGLEEGISSDLIDSYGVCSNGLSLPPSHPMHLPWMDVLASASDAVQKWHGDDDTAVEMANEVTGLGAGGGMVAGLSTVQLPANLVETRGLGVAEEIKEYLDSTAGEEGDETPEKVPYLPRSLEVFVTRPLTAYPDGGTGGAGVGGVGRYPIKLVDYVVDTDAHVDPPSSETGLEGQPSRSNHDDPQFVSSDRLPSREWTHKIAGAMPPHYQSVLNLAMAHFDATSILESSQERKLTPEERETLDGCRLLQSVLHDLDANLSDPDKMMSFAAYEDELYAKVIPVMHDTFEELDEGSAEVLGAFFKAHGAAVRCAVARNTRRLLTEGGAVGDGGSMAVAKRDDLPEDMALQEYAIRTLLGDRNVSRVIVGCPRPEHVMEAVMAADGTE